MCLKMEGYSFIVSWYPLDQWLVPNSISVGDLNISNMAMVLAINGCPP